MHIKWKKNIEKEILILQSNSDSHWTAQSGLKDSLDCLEIIHSLRFILSLIHFHTSVHTHTNKQQNESSWRSVAAAEAFIYAKMSALYEQTRFVSSQVERGVQFRWQDRDSHVFLSV